MVDSILRQAREEFDSVFAASEGMVITLGSAGDSVQAHMPGTRTTLRREAQFRAKVTGVTEGGKEFQEETVVRDISLQGALISLQNMPQAAIGIASDDGDAGRRWSAIVDAVEGVRGAD